ncbi:hypothetical protein KSS87_004008 [Heliosperma pusillum]|nr:hypothetical protein KSS87_021128 [Heliosperma pusillum]KAH9622066.1 hypothetical protein KSS87_004008 [Heliosperma pusillum]
MTMYHSCQVCPLSKFQGICVPFPRYHCISCVTRRGYGSNPDFVRSYWISGQDLARKSRFVVRNKDIFTRSSSENPRGQSKNVDDDSSGGWLDKWKDTRQRNLPKTPQPALNYRSRENVLNSFNSSGSSSNTETSGSTMDRIVEKLKRFGYMDDDNESEDNRGRVIEKGSVEDIFYVEEGMLPNTRGGFSSDSPLAIEQVFKGGEEVRFPWEKPDAEVEETGNTVKRRSRTYMAELTLPDSELRRLKLLTLRTKQKLRIGGAGVTQATVDAIHEKWKSSEVVRIKVEGAPALNMRRMHEILEGANSRLRPHYPSVSKKLVKTTHVVGYMAICRRSLRKTGGLVIWRSGTSVSLYRGVSYQVPSMEQKKHLFKRTSTQTKLLPLDQIKQNRSQDVSRDSNDYSEESLKEDYKSQIEVKYEDEIDELLSALGPRFTDWPGDEPLPVDADLLPSVVSGYKPPFRLLPYGVRRSLGSKEATALRRIARTLPPHFALGRSRQLEGLAAAIVKLWEKSSIAKVALKRGVQLTTSEKMAEEIKRLTGGIMLSRNKDFLVFYRGKDFLSPDVSEVLLERERLAKDLQDVEEQARMRASESVIPSQDTEALVRAAGTLSETLDADAKWGKKLDDHEAKRMMREVEVVGHVKIVKKLERKLAILDNLAGWLYSLYSSSGGIDRYHWKLIKGSILTSSLSLQSFWMCMRCFHLAIKALRPTKSTIGPCLSISFFLSKEILYQVALIVQMVLSVAMVAERKLTKAENALSKVEEFLTPADRQPDLEGISDEERFMFRKLGLRMKAFLLLGRRGVFDGTVENMHLHWKYRELVKIILKADNFEDVKKIALSLEAESGGILVSVDKVSKGYAIVVFRGKDYHRPTTLRPKNLLTKRKALARSIELQRREALLKHIAQLQRNTEKLRSEIEHVDMGDERNPEFYDSLDASYPTEDEDSEEEDETLLVPYYGSDENEGVEDEIDGYVHSYLEKLI